MYLVQVAKTSVVEASCVLIKFFFHLMLQVTFTEVVEFRFQWVGLFVLKTDLFSVFNINSIVFLAVTGPSTTWAVAAQAVQYLPHLPKEELHLENISRKYV